MITIKLDKHIAERYGRGDSKVSTSLVISRIVGSIDSAHSVDVSIVEHHYISKEHRWVEKVVKLGATDRLQIKNLAADLLKVIDV